MPFGVFLYFVKFFSRDKRFPDELHMSETTLVVKFYLDFFSFMQCRPKYS